MNLENKLLEILGEIYLDETYGDIRYKDFEWSENGITECLEDIKQNILLKLKK